MNQLQNKTRIIVINEIEYLKYFPRILVMQENTIIFDGDYEELCSKNHALLDKLQLVLQEKQKKLQQRRKSIN